MAVTPTCLVLTCPHEGNYVDVAVMNAQRHLREIPVKYLCWQLLVIARYPNPASFPARTLLLMGLFLQAGIVLLSGGGFESRSSVAIER